MRTNDRVYLPIVPYFQAEMDRQLPEEGRRLNLLGYFPVVFGLKFLEVYPDRHSPEENRRA